MPPVLAAGHDLPPPKNPWLAWFYRRVPAFDSLRAYGVPELRADFVAGLTVAAVAVPQAMAYGIAAGIPAEYGLYTAIVMTIAGALFDSSRQLVNGPTNATSIATLSAIAFVSAEGKVDAAILLAFLVGAVQLTITFLKLGDLTRYISHSVVVGFTAGAGTLLVLEQLKNLFGLKAMGDAHDYFLKRLWLTLTEGGDVHWPTFAMGMAAIVLTVALRWVKGRLNWPLLPEFLITVIVLAGVTWFFRIDELGVKVVGEIPAGLPSFAVPHLDLALMRDLAPSALAIAVLGLLEAMAMAKGIAAVTGQRLDPNQQCLSEGLANFTGSFFHCIPGSGSLTRSAINQQAGAASQWSGVWSALAVALIVMWFGPEARYIPKAVLAGLLVVTAWRMVDRAWIAYAVRATRFDAIIVAATALSAIAISIEFCILIGVFLSFLLAVPRTGNIHITEFCATPDGHTHERLPTDEPDARIRIFGLEGELFFGSNASLERAFDRISAQLSKGQVLVLRVKRLRNPDAVGLHMLTDFVQKLEKRGVHVLLCGVREDLHQALTRTGHIHHITPEHFFAEQAVRQTSTMMAIRYARELVTREAA